MPDPHQIVNMYELAVRVARNLGFTDPAQNVITREIMGALTIEQARDRLMKLESDAERARRFIETEGGGIREAFRRAWPEVLRRRENPQEENLDDYAAPY